MEERLQKIIAKQGIASRRHAEQMILAGRVYLNGQLATLGQKADLAQDQITVDGAELKRSHQPKHLFLLLHKPVQVVTTCNDPQGRRTVIDLLPLAYRNLGLHPVGRLDAETTGALLLTNDGDLTHALTHPRHHIAKTYRVTVAGQPSPQVLQQWRSGVVLEGRDTLPAQVRILKSVPVSSGTTMLEVILWEGRNRQIRKVAKILGHPVLQLHRAKIGPLSLRDSRGHLLPAGQHRPLSASEIRSLRHIIKIKGGTDNQKDVSV